MQQENMISLLQLIENDYFIVDYGTCSTINFEYSFSRACYSAFLVPVFTDHI